MQVQNNEISVLRVFLESKHSVCVDKSVGEFDFATYQPIKNVSGDKGSVDDMINNNQCGSL